MASEIWVAIIGLISCIIVNFREEIKNCIFRRGRYMYYRDTWQCHWIRLTPSKRRPNYIDDQVTISRVNGEIIKGRGNAPGFGNYIINGRASQFAATLHYCGEGENKNLVGVVILQIKGPNEMEGVWCQYSADGTLKSGTTLWKRIIST